MPKGGGGGGGLSGSGSAKKRPTKNHPLKSARKGARKSPRGRAENKRRSR